MRFCPQCGTPFEPNARFCMECGFDKSTVKLAEPTAASAPVVAVNESKKNFDVPMEVDGSEPEVKLACLQCGNVLDPGERFCPTCGFDSSLGTTSLNTNFKPVELPEVIYRPSIAYNQPDAGKEPPQIPEQQPEPMIPPPPEPAGIQKPSYTPSAPTHKPIDQKKGKKTWLWIAFVVIALGALCTAGWLGYNAYLDSEEETSSDTISNMELPPVTNMDTAPQKTEVSEEAHENASESPKQTEKAVSKIDKELKKQKGTEPGKAKQQTTVPVPKTKPDTDTKPVPVAGTNDNLSKVIFEAGRKEEPKSKNPRNPTKFTIQKPTMIVRITTDHYNNGMGTPGGGTISIRDRNGNVIGSFRAYSKSGKNGTPNAKWVSEPRLVLSKGTYFIWDSDMPTWSKTFLGTGFVVIEGYAID